MDVKSRKDRDQDEDKSLKKMLKNVVVKPQNKDMLISTEWEKIKEKNLNHWKIYFKVVKWWMR